MTRRKKNIYSPFKQEESQHTHHSPLTRHPQHIYIRCTMPATPAAATAASNQLDSSDDATPAAPLPPAQAGQVALYFALLVISQILSVYCAFVSLPYPNLSYWNSYQMVIPYSWGSWVFMTKAIEISNKYHIFDRNKMFFLLIITQFIIVMLFNYFYLKKPIKRSEVIGFLVLLMGFVFAQFNLFSWIANQVVPGSIAPPPPPAKRKGKKKPKQSITPPPPPPGTRDDVGRKADKNNVGV
jgi:uncharacterized protein (DUF486 family)